MPRVREIIGVDYDLDLLEYCQRWVEPLFTHYLEPRTQVFYFLMILFFFSFLAVYLEIFSYVYTFYIAL